MKKNILNAIVMVFAFPVFIQAQGTLYLSNLDQPSTDSWAIGSDSWIAQVFKTGANPTGYLFNSVQLQINTPSGNPNGFTVSIYADVWTSAFYPGNELAKLNGTNPVSDGVFTYTAFGLTLLPNTRYYIVLTAATSVTEGSYYWSVGPNGAGDYRTDGWQFYDYYYSSIHGYDWTESIRQGVFQLAITATPVPEPSPAWLLWLGGGVLFCARQRASLKTKKSA